MKYALGVDIGGTKTSITLGSSLGRVLAKKIFPTLTGSRTLEGIRQISEGLACLKADCPTGRRIQGVGVGVPGPMNPKTGRVEHSPHLSGWEGFPLKAFLKKKLKLPVWVTNDANAAALGEKVFGEGRGAKNFVYLTISTGIGGGIILNGALFAGSSFGAGEVGHTIVVPGGAKCGCGHRGCLEAYASGTAIAEFARVEIQNGKKSKLRQSTAPHGRLTAERVAEAAAGGDRLALRAFRRAGYFLGIGLANLINLLNPEKLILGGSVMKSSRFLWSSMMTSVRENAWPSLYRACRVVKTGLGGRVGDLGALALVFSESLRRRKGI